jgi:replication factor C subunit 2/4
VAHQEEVVRTLQKAIETANMPHMLFYGARPNHLHPS